MSHKRTEISILIESESERENVLIQGWVRTRRDSKDFFFLELNDGSCLKNLQVVVKREISEFETLKSIRTGSSVSVVGNLVASQGKGQKWEVLAKKVELLGDSPENYPLQKKRHSLEFMREISHLRPRANMFGAIFRIRSRLSFAIHRYFQENGFFYVNTPIITASDCEGAGDLFKVTTIDLHEPPRSEDGLIDFAHDFFSQKTYLTVSGQLEGEAFATSLGKIYTFGPTFRAENSNTSRHASEFWMVEPEIAFCDLQQDMDWAESFVKWVTREVLDTCQSDLELFFNFVDKGLEKRLRFVVERPFHRVSYTEAIDILHASGRKWKYPVGWGANLQSEHERYLTEEHFKSPVTVYDYPKEIKPFYMRTNDDEKTVAAMDILVPGIGEIVGGSQREERLDVLLENMKRHCISEEDYSWYVDLRRFGSVPHAGFGLGFERLLMFITGMGNIRDVIPFARTPGSI